ncbi:signal recognition particle receptor alpha subunit [Heterostelium album PN500]|uniref:Signal recognition particle receptor alpha subunit n=1 Tax=Heterostelium pallidum (strain ATCC 26659 / Pp 5 / PN500) TaxID=670386 RepID=D3BP70_HETP5|nr:signal recognition particle receptor alpha subunit [Heterostelium album PN500]EFA77080.1 signal recognition particle receptor alpha subunit [Heterostelium album PN500]|eukprot:XP_020429209.1 signal recognition particle receptor alpha subunit [Heterostelium album PN500]
MIDNFTILTKGGIVLLSIEWARLKGHPINNLIRKVLVQERGSETSFQSDNYTLKWTFANEVDLIFVVVYQKILSLMYIDELLNVVKRKFVKMYKDVLVSIKNSSDDLAIDTFEPFKEKFDLILTKVETLSKMKQSSAAPPKRYEDTEKGRAAIELKREKEWKDKKSGKSVNKNKSKDKDNKKKVNGANSSNRNQSSSSSSSDDSSENESDQENSNEDSNEQDVDSDEQQEKQQQQQNNNNNKNTPTSPKQSSVFDDAEDEEDPDIARARKALLKAQIGANKKTPTKKSSSFISSSSNKDKDINTPPPKKEKRVSDTKISKSEMAEIDKSDKSGKKKVVVKEKFVKHNMEMDVSSDEEDKPVSGFMKYFQTLTGSRTIDNNDLEPILQKLKSHLTSKNVALDIAEKLVDSVGQSLQGKKLSTFQGVNSVVKQAMEEAVTRILTPKKTIDILRDVQAVRGTRPYTIVFSGVNGVGKSTNLAKICYWLTAHGYKVMMAACDTFRSGAIEQLKTHAERLNVEVFERGYGKDAASIAGEAIDYARATNHDVVLIDTTGRMQNNEPLMRALSKLVNQNTIDLVLFVGEALVGNDGVDQLVKFDKSLSLLADSTQTKVRTIDGIILTKFDTIDDKVGAAISMVYSTGHPIIFLGTGQNYTDLKRMNVKVVVKSLLN